MNAGLPRNRARSRETASSRAPFAPGTAVALALLGASAAAAAMAGFWGEPTERYANLETFGLALVCANLGLLAIAAAFAARRHFAPTRVSGATIFALVALGVVTLAMVLASPSVMRVQTDESLIAGTAFGIWTGAGPVAPLGHFRLDGILETTTALVDKRGYGVPTLTAALHFIAGYRFDHGFWLNHVATWLALCAAYLLARRWLPRAESLSAALFLAAFPMIGWAATSQTLEAVNLAALLGGAAVMAAAARHDEATLACLGALLGAFVAHCRYESVIVGALSFPLAAWIAARRGGVAHIAVIAVVPWLYLPIAWQRAAPFNFDLAGAGVDRAFGAANFAANLPRAAELFLTRSDFNPTGPVIAALAAVAVLLALKRAARVAWSGEERLLVLYSIGISAIGVVVLSFAWGDPLRPETHRLVMPIVVLISLAAASLPALIPWQRAFVAPLVLACAGLCCIASTRVLPDDALGMRLLGSSLPVAHAEMRTAYPRCRLLWVSANAPYFILHGESALTPDAAAGLWSGASPGALPAVDAVVFAQFYNGFTGRVLDDAELPGVPARALLGGRVGVVGRYRVSQLAYPGEARRGTEGGCPLSGI